ncbi:MAG: alpha/beta fold hydrolase [Geodermatophilaceae bacterium]
MTRSRTVTVGSGLEIAYERYGSGNDPVLLMVHGFGVQLTGWNPELLAMLLQRNLQLVVLDNRDVGLSTHLDQVGAIDPMAVVSGAVTEPPYRLSDMAADTVGLLDALDLDSVHLLGVSLGGMVAQQLTIDAPGRVRSLTSMLSTPDMSLGSATPAAAMALLAPPASTREQAMDRSAGIAAVIGSPEMERDEAWSREAAGVAWDRNNDPAGVTRQFAAIRLSPDRRPGLATLDVPALVIHGAADPLIQLDGGVATAQAIPGAQLMVIPGMGHDLPRAVWSQVVDAIAGLVHRVEFGREPAAVGHPDTHEHARWGRLGRPDPTTTEETA